MGDFSFFFESLGGVSTAARFSIMIWLGLSIGEFPSERVSLNRSAVSSSSFFFFVHSLFMVLVSSPGYSIALGRMGLGEGFRLWRLWVSITSNFMAF